MTQPVVREIPYSNDSATRLVLAKQLTLPTAVLAVDANPDGKSLYAACFDGGVYEVTIASGVLRQLASHTSYASGVRYEPKNGVLISAGYDGILKWTSPAEAKAIRNVDAHRFWSWKMRLSPNGRFAASVTGQYQAGGYKYEPAAEAEPSIRVYEVATGRPVWSLPHSPPVLSVAFSPDSSHVAAANMMGEIRIWNVETGKQAASWTTPDFTSWGIIKSHHYIGGIFDLTFSPDGSELAACGMGPMGDPMAGHGKQTWQRFAWTERPPRKTAEILDFDSGRGLMEVLRYHPDGKSFVMAGKLAQGKWNAALFDSASGHLIHSLDTKMRITDAVWLSAGAQLALVGATSQERKKNGRCPDFGHVRIFDLQPV